MSYQIISTSDIDGTVTYEINYGSGVVREVLSVVDFPTADVILARIAEREKDISEEIASRKSTEVSVPDTIKKLIVTPIPAPDPAPDPTNDAVDPNGAG